MVDIVFIAIIVLFAYIGAKRGLIRTLIGLLTTGVSLVLSMMLYKPVSLALANSALGDTVRENIEKFIVENTGSAASLIHNGAITASSQIVINAISFVLIVILSKVIISIVVSIVNIASKLPVIRQANSLLGLVIGVISGVVICYIAIGVIGAAETEGSLSNIAQQIKDSIVASSFYYDNVITEILS